MLDIKFVRSNPDAVVAGMKKRGMDLDLAPFLALDEKRRALLTEVEQLKNTRNTVSKEIGKMKKAGENADELVAQMSKVGEDIKALDQQVADVDAKMEEIILSIPNIPHESLPEGGLFLREGLRIIGRLLLGHDAVSAGSCRIRLVSRSILLRSTFSDGIRHRLACVNQRQIPVGIPVGIRIFLHVFPIKAPRAQINVIVEFVIAVFIVAADTDHIIVVQKTGVNDPIGMLQCYVCKPATLGHHRTVLAGSGFTQTDLRGSHRFGSRVVLIPKLDCACVVCV